MKRVCAACGGRIESKGVRNGKRRLMCVACGRCTTEPLDPPLDPVIPHGHHVKGVSTLVAPDGSTIHQWVKTAADKVTREEALREAIAELPDLVPHRPGPVPVPPSADWQRCLSVYPIGDAHLGLLAWGQETGESWDTEKGKQRLRGMMDMLVQQGPPTERALLISLGDFFHTDNSQNRTARSNNALDVDTRYGRLIRAGLATAVGMIEAALTAHRAVDVIVEIGNHDDQSALWLGVALDAYYREVDAVCIDLSPAHAHYYRWGRCLVGVTHGDGCKPEALGEVMAAERPEDWGATRHRYWYTGHVHHLRRQELRGCVVEAFRATAPRDAWAASQHYRAGQDMTKISLHEDHGEVFRATCNAGALEGDNGTAG